MKRFADSLSAIDCNVLQSNRFRGLTATFLAHKPSVTPSYWTQKHPFRPEKEGFVQLKGGDSGPETPGFWPLTAKHSKTILASLLAGVIIITLRPREEHPPTGSSVIL